MASSSLTKDSGLGIWSQQQAPHCGFVPKKPSLRGPWEAAHQASGSGDTDEEGGLVTAHIPQVAVGDYSGWPKALAWGFSELDS